MNFAPGFRSISAGLLLGAAAASADMLLPLQQCYQERDQWCWAASSQAVLAFYGTNVSQGEIALYGTEGANIPNLLYGSAADPTRRGVDLILSRFRNIESRSLGYDLGLEQLRDEVETNGRPVVILWLWTSGDGHIVVLHGLSGEHAYVMDPWNGPTITTFSWLQQGSGHHYIDTLQLGSSAGALAATPLQHEFGLVRAGTEQQRAFVLTNAGRGTVCGRALVDLPFAVVSGGSYALAEGQSQVVTVRCSPQAPGQFQQVIRFTGGGGVLGHVSAYAVPVELCGGAGAGLLSFPPSTDTAVAMAAGGAHALVLRSDGTVVAWGDDSQGQTDVPAASRRVVAIASGQAHSLALRADGNVIAWGDNGSGQTQVPQEVANIVAIAAGQKHSLAVDDQGKLYAWGDDTYGQCESPSGLGRLVSVSAGAFHTLALRANGQVLGWGRNDVGQADAPEQSKSIIALAAGDAHSLALQSDGSVLVWGDGARGQADVPPGATNIVAIAAAGNYNLALRCDGRVIGWGDNSGGQFDVPVSATNVIGLAASAQFSLLLEDNPLLQPTIFGSFSEENGVAVALPTVCRKTYYLEATEALWPALWFLLDSAAGDGAGRILRDRSAWAPRQFYRVRVAKNEISGGP